MSTANICTPGLTCNPANVDGTATASSSGTGTATKRPSAARCRNAAQSARAKFLAKEIKRLERDLNHPWQKSPEWRQQLESRIAALRAEMEASDA